MNDEKYYHSGVELPLEDLKFEENVALYKEFFQKGISYLKKGYKAKYSGVSGEARSHIWNELEDEINEFIAEGGHFRHFFGPILSYDPKRGHIFLKLLYNSNEYFKDRVEIYLSNSRLREHDLVLSCDGEFGIEGIFLYEKYHPIIREGKEDPLFDARFKSTIEISGNKCLKPDGLNVELARHIFNVSIKKMNSYTYIFNKIKDEHDFKRLKDSDIVTLANTYKEKEIGDFDFLDKNSIDKLIHSLDLKEPELVENR